MNAYKLPFVSNLVSKNRIDKAWKTMIDHHQNYASQTYQDAFWIINERRKLHIYPLNTFQANLRTRIKNMGIENDTIVSQRIKRIVSITAKLQRFEHTQLSRMQDIWWIRAIVPDLKSITLLMDYYQHKSFKSYMLIRQKNYIEEPKADWYRSVHLIFQYTSSRYLPAQWVYFEFQIRTMIQHARATAVETVGTFLWQALKANQWSQEWRDYFRLVSAGFCFLEWTKIDPYFADKSHQDIVKEIKKKTHQLKVTQIIKWFSVAAKEIKKALQWAKKTGLLHLIILDTKLRHIQIKSFTAHEKEMAFDAYQLQEQDALFHPHRAVVLVSTNQIANLEKAYPSFFWDNQLFLNYINKLTATWS